MASNPLNSAEYKLAEAATVNGEELASVQTQLPKAKFPFLKLQRGFAELRLTRLRSVG
jgi:hypothetical protein